MEEVWHLSRTISYCAPIVRQQYNTQSEWHDRCEWRERESLCDRRNTHGLACAIRMVGAIGMRHFVWELAGSLVKLTWLLLLARFRSLGKSTMKLEW